MKNERGEWYLMYVGSNREKKCERMLKALTPSYKAEEDIHEIYIPQEETKMPDGKITTTNLYPGYMFIRLENYDRLKPLLRKVSNLKLHPSDESTVKLSTEEATALNRIKYKPELLKEELFSIDQEVRVVNGVFENFTGKIIELHPVKQIAKLLINIFGRDTPVELSFSELEKVK